MKKFYFLINEKKLKYFNFNFLQKKLIILINDRVATLNFNFMHYKGFCGFTDKILFFKNKISIIKIVRRILNLIKGILHGFCIILEIIGLGFSVTNNGLLLRFNIGFNHSIYYYCPKLVKIFSKRKVLYLFSFSYFILKKIIIDLKNLRKLNAYKLKGIKEKNELFIKKNWKKKVN